MTMPVVLPSDEREMTEDVAWQIIRATKRFIDSRTIVIRPGRATERGLKVLENGFDLLLSVYKGRRNNLKINIHKRTSRHIALIRLDICPATTSHTNPDGAIIRGSHLHVFDQAFGMKVARPLSDYPNFRDSCNAFDALTDFAAFCSIEVVPGVQEELL